MPAYCVVCYITDYHPSLGNSPVGDALVANKPIPARIVCTRINDLWGRGYTLLAVGTYADLLG